MHSLGLLFEEIDKFSFERVKRDRLVREDGSEFHNFVP